MKPHTIYAFDILDRNGGQFLGNRRVFAVSDNGEADVFPPVLKAINVTRFALWQL